MRLIILAMALFSASPLANADLWTNYLKIDCEPSILYFSVQPIGTWAQDVEPPEGFIPLSNGWTHPEAGEDLQKAVDSDLFGECKLPYRGDDLVFSVVRTRSLQPAGCRGCATWRAIFQIRINDHILTEGRHGGDDTPALKSVQYDGEEIRICDSPVPHHYREIQDNQTNLTCQILGWKEIQEVVISKSP